MHYGATDDEWALWDSWYGLTEDLLPVVCRPGQTLHPNSVLKEYGKVPSRYAVQRQVVGFPNWTTYRTQTRDISLWQRERDYGICVQTRHVRALDFDITDHAFAEYLRTSLEFLGYQFPWRTRANSSKFLTLFFLEGDYGKRVLTTVHGGIEFLATGQQAVVAGTHASGARIEWDWTYPIPTFTHESYLRLLSTVSDLTESQWSDESRSRIADRNDTKVEVDGDPVALYLIKHGWAI